MFDSLGDRMKGYEHAARLCMPRRMPVVLRVDGKSFHTWTRRYSRPFDGNFMALMDAVAMRLCSECQGARLAYVQSDEISLLLHNYAKHDTQPWFENQVQKIASVAASIAAAEMTHLAGRPAYFDARVFVLPEADVTNYFLWRQNDASRNSIQMLAQSLYSAKQLNGKCQAELHEMCFQKGQNWNDLRTELRRGRCVVRAETGWVVDREIPIWKADGREYVERLLQIEAEEAAA